MYALAARPGCSDLRSRTKIRIEIYRLKPRENPQINQWWMCDEGRYGFKHVHDPRRVTQLRQRTDDGYTNVEWSELPKLLDDKLKAAGTLTAVLSPHLTVEEAYLLVQYMQGIDADAKLVLGLVPVQGEDQSFPNGFTIRAEKCPNRRGVEAIVSRFGSGAITRWTST